MLAGMIFQASSASRPDLDAYQASSQASLIPISAGKEIQQTFLSTQVGMKAVAVFSKITPSARLDDYALSLQLYDQTGSTRVAHLSIPLAEAVRQPRIELRFAPRFESRNRGYLLLVTTDAPEGLIALYASRGERYPGGSLSIDGEIQTSDLAFQVDDAISLRAEAEYASRLLGQFARGLAWFAMFLLLGSALLFLMVPSGLFDLPEWGGLALACALGAIPLCFQAFSILRIPVTPGSLLAAALALLAGAGLKLVLLLARQYAWHKVFSLRVARASVTSLLRAHHFDALWLLGWLAAWGARVSQARSLAAPGWIDSVNHFELIQRILADQGIPQGLLYHTGYHSLVAAINLFSGQPIAEDMLMAGQWISALVGLSTGLLALMILKDRRAALCAAGLIWFISPFPSYLFNWGRYPFLMGLFMLCAVLALSLKAWRQPSWGLLGAGVFLLAGMIFCHYGMLTLWLSFAVIYLIGQKISREPFPWVRKPMPGVSARVWLFVLALLALGAAIVLSRFLPLFDLEKLQAIIIQSRQAASNQDYRELVRIALSGPGALFGLVCLYGIGIAWQFHPRVVLLSLGWGAVQAGLIALLSPWLGEAIASYTNLIIFLPVPLSLLGGAACAWLLQPIPPPEAQKKTRARKPASPASRTGHEALISAALFALVMVITGWQTLAGQLNPAAVLVTPADARAMRWIERNTPPGAVFLVNSGRWGADEITPVDGGAWLTGMTSRPVAAWESDAPAGADPVLDFEAGWDYLYLGKGSGVLDSSTALAADGAYQVVYDSDGIRIFANQ